MASVLARRCRLCQETGWYKTRLSEQVLPNVEEVLVQVNASYISTGPEPTDEQVMLCAKSYGSYVGEVYRRNHGWRRGMVTLGENRLPGLQTTSGSSFGRAFNRIKGCRGRYRRLLHGPAEKVTHGESARFRPFHGVICARRVSYACRSIHSSNSPQRRRVNPLLEMSYSGTIEPAAIAARNWMTSLMPAFTSIERMLTLNPTNGPSAVISRVRPALVCWVSRSATAIQAAGVDTIL